MSWETNRRRRKVLLTTLCHARRHPERPIPFEQVPHATEVFTDRNELLLALHHRWMLLLSARLELALADAGDRVEAVIQAWRQLAADERVLRRVLDAHAISAGDVLRDAVRAEHRMLALWSGLADITEPAGDVAKIGAAFAELLRAPGKGPVPATPRCRVRSLVRS